MENVQVLQNTEEWLNLRLTKIGASESNIIMGVSKFSTPKQLLEYKINPSSKKEKDNSFITDKGHKLEEKIRAMVEIDTDLDFPPLVALSSEYDFLMASLDGYNEENKIVLECKYVGEKDFELVASGFYLDQYYPQIQHQMLVTGAKKNILAVCKEVKTSGKKDLKYTSIEILFDEDYCKNKLLPALRKFWEDVTNGRKGVAATNTGLSKDDILDQTSDEKLAYALENYKKNMEQKEHFEAEAEHYKEMIFSIIKHNKVKCGNATVQKIQVKGRETIDYKTFIKDSSIEIPEKYIKIGSPTEQKKITFKE